MNIISGELYWWFNTEESAILLQAKYDSKNNLAGDVIATSRSDIQSSIFNITTNIHEFRDFYPGPKYCLIEQFLIKDLFERAQ